MEPASPMPALMQPASPIKTTGLGAALVEPVSPIKPTGLGAAALVEPVSPIKPTWPFGAALVEPASPIWPFGEALIEPTWPFSISASPASARLMEPNAPKHFNIYSPLYAPLDSVIDVMQCEAINPLEQRQ